MWVAPGDMLYQVYGNAFSYAFQGARLIALEETPAAPVGLDTSLTSLGGILSAILWRTTPTWLGVMGGLLLAFTRDRELVPSSTRWTGLLALALAAAFILMFGLARGRNSPHYTLTSYAALNLFAGLGWFHALAWLAGFAAPLRSNASRSMILFLVLASQAFSASGHYPYYFTYENPILAGTAARERPKFAYGEGLELAGRYLSGLPEAQDLAVLAYYSRGCFSYFFPGRTERKPIMRNPATRGPRQSPGRIRLSRPVSRHPGAGPASDRLFETLAE
jgi:hypothetical protein